MNVRPIRPVWVMFHTCAPRVGSANRNSAGVDLLIVESVLIALRFGEFVAAENCLPEPITIAWDLPRTQPSKTALPRNVAPRADTRLCMRSKARLPS
jgi:hypothetical protein